MKKISYGVIGIKGIGDLHCRLARQKDDVELTALADIDAELVKKKSGEVGVEA